MWKMEVADDAAPGAYFHVQVLGRESDTHFPKALDVPRLPNFLASPLACAEFAISELFQDEWKKHSMRSTDAMNRVGRFRLSQAWAAHLGIRSRGEPAVTLFHSAAFDFSVWEMWGAFAYGGRLVVVPFATSRTPEAYFNLLRDTGVTVLNQTPAAFRQLMTVAVAHADTLALLVEPI